MFIAVIQLNSDSNYRRRPTVLPAAPVGLPVPSTEAGQVVIQLQQQGIPAGTVATSEAELLLQLQQQPYQ